jgi:hypothetical protein
MRFRVFLILVGGLLVIATYTFPLWQPLVRNISITTPNEVFPGLPQALQSLFVRLPPDQQAAYRELAAVNQDIAVRMVTAALEPSVPAPEADAEIPTLNSPITAAVATFSQIDPIRWAQGSATIYLGADERKILRFEDFVSANGGDLRVILSANALPTTSEEMRLRSIDFDVGALRGTFGNQNYELPVELVLTDYASIVIYSPGLDMIFSVAPLILFI